MDSENKTPQGIALEFIAEHPELIEHVEGDAFQTFWEYPMECIQMYEQTIQFMKTSFRIPDDVIKNNCQEYLAEACEHVANLKAIQP